MRLLLFLLLLLPVCFWGQSAEVPARPALKVAVYDVPPFGLRYPDSTYGGLMVELWEDLADDLGFAYAYTLADMNSLLTGLREQRFDVGLGAISITPRREALVDFTQAVNPSGTGIATAASSQRNAFANYWKPILINLLELILPTATFRDWQMACGGRQ